MHDYFHDLACVAAGLRRRCWEEEGISTNITISYINIRIPYVGKYVRAKGGERMAVFTWKVLYNTFSTSVKDRLSYISRLPDLHGILEQVAVILLK
jgi:hypothetical protein